MQPRMLPGSTGRTGAAILSDAAAAEIVAVAARRNPLLADAILSGPTASRSGETQFSPFSSSSGLNLTLTGAVTNIVMLIAGKRYAITGAKTVTLTNNSLNFVYYDADSDTLGATVYPCAYSREAPSAPATNQPWFDMNTGLMKFYSGAAWVAYNRIFLGIWTATSNAIDSVYSAPAIGWNVRTLIDRFGGGTDGAIVYNNANARWEDSGGTALATVAGKWTVSGATLTAQRRLMLAAMDIQNGGTFQDTKHVGNNAWTWHDTQINGYMRVRSGGIYTGGMFTSQNGAAGGAAKATAGAGNTAQATQGPTLPFAGRSGGGGSGGGDGTNIGGTGVGPALGQNNNFWLPAIKTGGVTTVGTTGAGTSPNAVNPNGDSADADFWSIWTLMPLYGEPAKGGGSGALKQAGGSNVGGAGGDGGRGGAAILLWAYQVQVDAGGKIHADGENGVNGSPGVATNAAGDISGGGGGGGAGGGGTVLIGYGPGGYTNSGTVSAALATGGTGGLGYDFNATPNATRNGGNGRDSSAGIVRAARIF